jgi:hypothetical protein
MLAGLLLAGAAACTAGGASAPAAESRPTSAPNTSTPTTGTPTLNNPGYLPDDPLKAVANGVESIRRANTGTLIETRRLVAADTEAVITVETTFQLSPYLSLSRVTFFTDLGPPVEVRLGQRDGVRMVQPPDEWGGEAGAWYRLYEPDDDFLADQLPTHALHALASAGLPGWISGGDAVSPTVTYDVTVTAKAAADLLTPELRAAVLKAEEADEYALTGVVPARVSVAADGALQKVYIDATSPASLAVSSLGSFDFDTFPRPFEFHVTLEIVTLGGSVDIDLPRPESIPEMPQLLEELTGGLPA